MEPLERLEAIKAPSSVLCMVQLFDALAAPTGVEVATSGLLQLRDAIARRPGLAEGDWPLLPEIADLIALDDALPEPLRLKSRRLGTRADAAAPGGAASPVAEPGPLVLRTVEATTPVLWAPKPFVDAAKLADEPARWAEAAPQITVRKAVRMPANGARARWRLTKHTDLLRPFAPGLATEETIAITVEGADLGAGRGRRRYSHTLESALERPGLLPLHEDSGFIELSGDAGGCLLRIHKRVVIGVPRHVDDRFGGLLPTALAALLWCWASAFLETADAAPEADRPANHSARAPAPREIKRVVPQAGPSVTVAVLGGGPAGLACAWLLSRPPDEAGKPLWDPPAGGLSVGVKLLEQKPQLGGKAASSRSDRAGRRNRIEEHGLHVVMGFYKNLRRIVSLVGAAGSLQPIRRALIPPRADAGPADAWQVELAPWGEPKASPPLLEWLGGRVQSTDWDAVGLRDLSKYLDPAVTADGLRDSTEVAFVRLASAAPRSRPGLRAFTRLWGALADLGPGPDGRWTSDQAEYAALQMLLKRGVLAEMAFAADREELPERNDWPESQPPSERVASLLEILRHRARSALRGDDPQVSLLREGLELATTIAIGLDNVGLLPVWALDRPADLVDRHYVGWLQGLRRLDETSLSEWLEANGAPKGFGKDSRLVDALTASVFTTADKIGAGTFINGVARLLMTYDDAPYLRLLGGTSEAVIDPIEAALNASGRVAIMKGCEVKGFTVDDGAVTGVRFTVAAPPPGAAPPSSPLGADAFVLAIPPFDAEFQGLPGTLIGSFQKIDHCATLSVQHWTSGPPLFPRAIMAGLEAPYRCVAAMDHLLAHEGPEIRQAPVYYCGEIDKDKEADFEAKGNAAAIEWLAAGAVRFQSGAQAQDPLVKFNFRKSDRYVCADSATQAARLFPYETGIRNLWLAGDWTRTALSCGSIEAAVTSGLEAARDILHSLGCTVHFPIVGACFERPTP
jgi:hypothetical protein